MASVRYGAMITGLKGKVNGQNFQTGLGTPVLRNIAVRRRMYNYTQVSLYSTNNRANLRFVAQSWRGLSSAQRAAYAAVTSSFPRFNKWGVSYVPSAYQLFMEMNLGLLSNGGSLSATPPTVSAFPASLYAVSVNLGTSSITVTVSSAFDASPYTTLISSSYYLSNGLGFNKSRVIMLAHHSFSSGSPSFNVYSLLNAQFGEPITGTTLYLYFRKINFTTGEMSAGQSIQVEL